jgi:serine/threonine protein kinase
MYQFFTADSLTLIMQRRYPHQLSKGTHHYVVALDEDTVAKIFEGDAHSDIETEAAAMRFANEINDLVVKLVRTDFDEQLDADVLVMERLYAFDYRAYELEKKELWLEAFEYELKQLHEAGWLHGDLYQPGNAPGASFDNIFLTPQGIRLIDTGKAVLRLDAGEMLFEKKVRDEWEAVSMFKEYFLRR